MNALRKTLLTWAFGGLLVAALLWTGAQWRLVRAPEEEATSAPQGDAAEADGVPQEAWVEITGQVVASEDNTLVIQTEDGTRWEIGLGPLGYWLGHGIPLRPGDQVQILGFFGAEGELEPAQIFNRTTGQSVALRDAEGSPLWRGSESH